MKPLPKPIRQLALLLLAVLALLLVVRYATRSADFPSEPEIVLRYADNQPEDYPTTIAARFFADSVYNRSGGRIKILIYCDEALGTETEAIRQVQFGGIDFARVSAAQLCDFSPELTVLNLPYLYRDETHMWDVLDGEIGNELLHSIESAGFIGLSWYDAGVRSFYTTKPVHTLSDLAGLTMRVQESQLMVDVIHSLGASPVAIPYSNVYSALKTGAVNGAENNLPSFEASKHYEVAKYLLLDEHSRIPEMQIMYSGLLDELSEDDISLLYQCARESASYERSLWKAREKSAAEKVRAAGVQISLLGDAEREHFRNACLPVYNKYAAGYEDLLRRIQAVR